MGKYIGVAIATAIAILVSFFGVEYSIPEVLVFAIILVILAIWFGFYQEEAIERIPAPKKIIKLFVISFVELFVLFAFVNVIMFPEFYFSNILSFYYFARVFSLMIIYWFTYFFVRMLAGMGNS